jgi:tetratricopeptide (TPR) repeat protein
VKVLEETQGADFERVVSEQNTLFKGLPAWKLVTRHHGGMITIQLLATTRNHQYHVTFRAPRTTDVRTMEAVFDGLLDHLTLGRPGETAPDSVTPDPADHLGTGLLEWHKSVETQLRHARELSRNRSWADLERASEELIQLDPGCVEALTMHARARGARGDPRAAIADLGRALQFKPGRDELLSDRGGYYHTLGDDDKALRDFEAALVAAPQNHDALIGRGNIRRSREDRKGALEDYSKALEVVPGSTSARYERAWTYYLKGDYAFAIRDYDQLIERDPKFAAAYRERGEAHRAAGHADLAIADFTKAVEISPKEDRAYSGRGRLRLERGDWDAALADFDRAASLQPNKPETWIDLARFHCARAASSPAGGGPGSRESHIDQALLNLEKAAARNYRSWKTVREDPAFQILRDSERYRKLPVGDVPRK